MTNSRLGTISLFDVVPSGPTNTVRLERLEAETQLPVKASARKEVAEAEKDRNKDRK